MGDRSLVYRLGTDLSNYSPISTMTAGNGHASTTLLWKNDEFCVTVGPALSPGLLVVG